MSDEQEYFQNFNEECVHINSSKSSDAIPSATPPKHKTENPIIQSIQSNPTNRTLDSDNYKIFYDSIVALEKLDKKKKFSNFEISYDTLLKQNQQIK